MARCSVAKPFSATATSITAAPRLSPRHRRRVAAVGAALQLPALRKPPPPPPLHPRPNLPVPTTTSHDDDDGPATRHSDRGKRPVTAWRESPSLSGAGDVLRLLDALRLPPDEDVYVSLLRDCADAAEVASVHAHIAGSLAVSGLPLPLANRLVLAYAACGDTGTARQVFDEMPVKNGITWATMVSAYSDGCFHHDALRLFAQMCHQVQGLTGDHYTHAIVAVLRSCARVDELDFGEQVHAFLVKKNGVCGDVGSSLLQLYCHCRQQSSARHVLQMMRSSSEEPVPEAAWTSLIKASHHDGCLDDAIDIFRDMASSGILRSSFSLSSILAVCAEAKGKGCYGQQVHADAIKRGLDMNQFVGSGLLHMYAKQGQLEDAARAFDAIGGTPDAVCWSAMAMAYARGGMYREATRVVYQMKASGMDPSELMMNEVKLACFR
ncbi:pentatricopeptide repeat-containing protein At4g18520, chloroplastic [Oryza brachyantha]|uniref:pentatricopeptide repeat-containing protein At4g18520, chloroplastic n=1 Tax=Oryza brachyantha TaxID=4533 RepID=UPI001ADBC96A|nr:pentatricopeptide repeat-containing protein At4g18520, chloroplastic [Oryza brachyantha]